jgi:hypothetical protein
MKIIPWIKRLSPTTSQASLERESCETEAFKCPSERLCLTTYPTHMPEFDVALHTGMRPSEQYSLIWSRVDFARQLVTVPEGKNGKTRHIPLNSVAVVALKPGCLSAFQNRREFWGLGGYMPSTSRLTWVVDQGFCNLIPPRSGTAHIVVWQYAIAWRLRPDLRAFADR